MMMNKMTEDIKQQMKGHSEKVSELICAMGSTVGECAEIGSAIDVKMQQIYEQIREIILQIQQNGSEMKNIVEPALQASETNVRQMKMEIIESLDAHLIAVNKERALFTQPKLSDEFKTKHIEIKDTITQKMFLVNDLLENVAKNNTSAVDTSKKYIETISNSLPSKRDIIEVNSEIPMLRSGLNENQFRLSDEYKENVQVLNEITSNTKEMSKKMTQEISACCNQLKYFCEMDFCIYEPLGNLRIFQGICSHFFFTLFKIKIAST